MRPLDGAETREELIFIWTSNLYKKGYKHVTDEFRTPPDRRAQW